MYFSFLLWASTIAAIQPGLSSSNVLCFIAIVVILSFEQINHCHCHWYFDSECIWATSDDGWSECSTGV